MCRWMFLAWLGFHSSLNFDLYRWFCYSCYYVIYVFGTSSRTWCILEFMSHMKYSQPTKLFTTGLRHDNWPYYSHKQISSERTFASSNLLAYFVLGWWFLLLLLLLFLRTFQPEFIWVWQQRMYVWKEMETTVSFVFCFQAKQAWRRDKLDL